MLSPIVCSFVSVAFISGCVLLVECEVDGAKCSIICSPNAGVSFFVVTVWACKSILGFLFFWRDNVNFDTGLCSSVMVVFS